MTALKHAILHSLLQKESLCCLCFNTVGIGTGHVYLDDVATVNDSGNIKLSEVLNYILGCDVMDNLAFQTLCDECVVSAIQSYSFIKRCKENTGNLQESIENLDNCLQSCTSQIDLCKSLFLSLDPSLAAQAYYDYKQPVTSLPKALARFKCVSSDICNGKYYVESSVLKESKTWIAPNFNDDSDDDFDSDWCIRKAKKSHRHKKDILSDSVMLHENSSHKKPICNGCEKTFENLTMLRMHYMRVHAVKKLQCTKCDHKFATHKLLENHLSLSHVNAVCFECGKTFTNVASLKKHELSHNVSSKYVCQNCHRVYKTLRTMKDHIYNGVCERGGRTSKSASIGKFVCDICKNHFATKNAVRSHLITLHGFGSDDVVHTCSWCNKRFEAASSLKSHIVKHTRERRFQCDLCNEKFVTQPALVNHTRLHTGEKPFTCDYCDESFISASRRMEHMRRKHLEPSQPCGLCSMIFKSGAGKRKHERRHFNPASKLYVPEALRPVAKTIHSKKEEERTATGTLV